MAKMGVVGKLGNINSYHIIYFYLREFHPRYNYKPVLLVRICLS